VTLDRQKLAQQAAALAAQGVYIGTSSWKYTGWCGTLYDRARYECQLGRLEQAKDSLLKAFDLVTPGQ
jgi:hypothetical protein